MIRPVACVTCMLIVLLVLGSSIDAKRTSSSGSRSRGGSRTPSPPPRRTPAPSRPKPSSSDTFLNAERGSSSRHPTNHNPSAPQHPHTNNQFNPSAPQHPHTNNQFNPSAPQPPHTNTQFHPSGAQPTHTNGPIGFEGINNANNQGNRPIGFDNVNSQVQNKPVGNSPPYPVGPPPAYGSNGGSYGGNHEHPPAYPGRPVNAPPSYQPNNPQPGTGHNYPSQYNPYQGQHNSYPNQQSSYPGQTHYPGQYNPYPGQQASYPGQYNHYPNQHNSYPGQYNPYPGQYNPYPGQHNFGSGNPFGSGHGSYSPYPTNNGYYPGGSYSFPGATSSGSPFGGSYNGNPHYSPYNFGYSGYPGQYNNNQQKSRFGGLPIPIPIPIPIGGGGLFGDHSYSHHVLDSFIKSKKTSSTDNSTSIFLLNNSTVAPCTTDHFIYDLMKVTVVSCTAEHCTAIKVTAITNTTKVTYHSAAITMCLENNVTISTHGSKVVPTVSEVRNETTTLCRDIPQNVTVTPSNTTLNISEGSTTSVPVTDMTTTDSTTISVTTTEVPTTTELTTVIVDTTPSANTTTNSTANSTRLCEKVECWSVDMCMPTIEIEDKCNAVDCPFRRTGYTSCVKVKMCRSPTVPISTSATLNNTVSKIDEYNRFDSVYDLRNLTLISYHRPVISFNCSQNASAPGCPPPPSSTTTSSTPAPTTTSAPAVRDPEWPQWKFGDRRR